MDNCPSPSNNTSPNTIYICTQHSKYHIFYLFYETKKNNLEKRYIDMCLTFPLHFLPLL